MLTLCLALHANSLHAVSPGKASQLYSHSLPGLFDHARHMQKLPVAIPTHRLPDKMIPRWPAPLHCYAKLRSPATLTRLCYAAHSTAELHIALLHKAMCSRMLCYTIRRTARIHCYPSFSICGVFNRKFAVTNKIPDTKGCQKCCVGEWVLHPVDSSTTVYSILYTVVLL